MQGNPPPRPRNVTHELALHVLGAQLRQQPTARRFSVTNILTSNGRISITLFQIRLPARRT
jgi:hypothetical protein